MPEPNLTPTPDQTIAAIESGRSAIAASGAAIPSAWIAMTDQIVDSLVGAIQANETDRYEPQRALARKIFSGGRNACWAMASATTAQPATSHAWLSAASGHQRILLALRAGWPILQSMRNPLLPLEYNNLPDAPKRPLVTDMGSYYLGTLAQDPIGITADQAQSGFVGIPAGVFLSGTLEA